MHGRFRFHEIIVTDTEVYIVDDASGDDMSVTNAAESVVKAICQRRGDHVRIMYRDTDGRWGELAHNKGVFTGFKEHDGPPN